MAEQTYKGTCFCGAVEITLTGAPEAVGYCHCTSCRAWSAAPINAFTPWRPTNVTVTKGKSDLGEFRKTNRSHRRYCRKCGGHLMAVHPDMGLIDVDAAVIPDLQFIPTVHVQYGEKVVSMRDGLPTFNDVPTEMGGSGRMLPE